jgi:hypothetical protein
MTTIPATIPAPRRFTLPLPLRLALTLPRRSRKPPRNPGSGVDHGPSRPDVWLAGVRLGG